MFLAIVSLSQFKVRGESVRSPAGMGGGGGAGTPARACRIPREHAAAPRRSTPSPARPTPPPPQIAYSLLMRAAAGRASNDVLAALQATLKQHLAFAESIFGQPHTFTPSATHVLLVAIMICLLANRR